MQSTKRTYDFPEPELLTNLIAIYFTHIAPMVPLLHRPTFMNRFNDGLHLSNDKFGAILLLVCATASRYSPDPRTLLEGGHLHSAGWKWFIQVDPFSRVVLAGPELYDLQIAAVSFTSLLELTIIFGLTIQCCSLPQCMSTVHYHPTNPGSWSASVCD